MKFKLHLPQTIMMIVVSFFLFSCDSEPKAKDAEAAKVTEEKTADYQISLAQWSFHKSYFGGPIEDWVEFGRLMDESPDDILKGDIDPKDFPELAASYGIKTIELVNVFYFTKADDQAYWTAFKKKCEAAGVNVGLIMCDRLGSLGDADLAARTAAVENHYKWVDVASFLGAPSIRVNAAGSGSAEEVAANAVDGLSKLAAYGAKKGVNIIVENHGGYSSDGKWLSGVMKEVGMDNVGTLPDFGNFCIERGPDGCVKEYDKYKGIAELMPYAKGVSAKSHTFDENGNEVNSDFLKIMQIVKKSGFKGYVGIEYEGSELSEDEGVKATKALLEKVFSEI